LKFKAKLNLKLYKLYIAAILLFGIVILGWYGVYFLNKNTIFMEDNLPMDNRIKLLFSIAIGVVVLSWTISLFTLVRQIWMGQAFSMDEEGIHSTATGTIIFALIFIIPVRTIPYSAIENISEESGVLTLHIDKAKIDMIPILRIFAEKRYHLFSGFTAEKQENIKSELYKFIK